MSFLLIGIAAGKATRHELGIDCGLGDAALMAHVGSLLVDPRQDPQMLGYVVASARLARGFCLGRSPGRGVQLYARINGALEQRAMRQLARAAPPP